MNNKLQQKAMKSFNSVDFSKVAEMMKSFDINFKTLSENQVYMQENQVEFEKYLKAILKNQELILKEIRKDEQISDLPA